MQISKKSIMADLYGCGGFFVEHIELDMCVKFQVSQSHGVRDVIFPKLHFLNANYSATIWPIVLVFIEKHLHIISSYWAKFHVSSAFHLTGILAAAADNK